MSQRQEEVQTKAGPRYGGSSVLAGKDIQIVVKKTGDGLPFLWPPSGVL